MKILGVDYGSKRIGLAISDEGMNFAFPKRLLQNDQNAIEEIGHIIKEEKIFEIVVGDTLDMSGQKNEVTTELESFIEELGHKFQLPIKKEREFFTSIEARGREGKESLNARETKKIPQGKVDASAAALILQRYLDRRSKSQG